jgi:glycosyltransferase involved in cell wall biosynthesis
MRVLLIASLAESLVNFRGALIKAFLRHGMDVHVAAPELLADSAVCQQLKALGVQVHNISLHRTGCNPITDVATLFSLYQLLRNIRPSHVLGYTIKPVVYGSIAARLAGVPNRYVLITGLGYAFGKEDGGIHWWLGRLAQQLYRLALGGVHKVFFQNPDNEALFRRLSLLSKRIPSVVVNGSGVDIERFQKWSLPLGPPRFLLIARLLSSKGVREYAQAARILRKKYPKVCFALVGWIDNNPDAIDRSELDEWIEQEVLDYQGHLRDVRPAIEACSVYVLPSYSEGTPRTVLEAMAMGRAIITTDAPGCRETVVDGKNGFLVPVRSVEALVQTMELFIHDDGLAASMGQRSREIAEDKYDVHKVNGKMLHEMGIV